jgi:glycosyltransferase involved in cell wall biosynthesis
MPLNLFWQSIVALIMLVGDGPEMAAMKAQAKTFRCSERILFVGSRPRYEVPDFHAALDVFVFPSITDMQPLAVVKAMLSGLPIVAIGEAGIPFIVKDGETGFLTPQDTIGFANSVRTLLDKSYLRIAMGERARQYAMLNFSTDACTDKLETVYRRVLAEEAVAS